MPEELTDAHRKLDAAVDHCYRKKQFNTDAERMEYLFGLYRNLIEQENARTDI